MSTSDDFIQQQLAPRLESDESILATAVLSTKSIGRFMAGGTLAMMGGGYFLAALTPRRVLLIHTRRGPISVKMLNEGISEVAFADIQAVRVEGRAMQRTLSLSLRSGATLTYHMTPLARGGSGPDSFIDALTRLHAGEPLAPAVGDDTAVVSEPQPESDVMMQLKELAAMHQAGVLTAEEYSATKAALLAQI